MSSTTPFVNPHVRRVLAVKHQAIAEMFVAHHPVCLHGILEFRVNLVHAILQYLALIIRERFPIGAKQLVFCR